MSKAKSKSVPYKQPILPIIVLFLLLSTGLTLLFVLMSRTNREPQQSTATPTIVASEPRLIHSISLPDPIRDIAFSPTNQLAVLAFNRVYLADLQEDDIASIRELYTTQDVVFPNTDEVFFRDIWDLTRYLAFDSSGSVLYAGSTTGYNNPMILRWDMTTEEELPAWRVEADISSYDTSFAIDFAVGENTIALLLLGGHGCSHMDFVLYQWDLETGEPVEPSLPAEVPGYHHIGDIEYSGDVFAMQSSEFSFLPPECLLHLNPSQIAIIRNGELVAAMPPVEGYGLWYMRLSPDGQYLAGTAMLEPVTLDFPHPKYGVFIWQNGEFHRTLYETNLLQDMAFTPDNRYLFIVSPHQILMIDVALGERIRQFEIPVDFVKGNYLEPVIKVSPDGRFLALSKAEMLFVWSLEY
jgi:hypothetical protein